MKYRLKRDLPFAKAGTIVQNYLGNQDFNINVDTMSTQVWVKPLIDFIKLCPPSLLENNKNLIYVGSFGFLLTEGWIEEVKPREWWMIKEGNCPPFSTFYTRVGAEEYIKNRYGATGATSLFKIVMESLTHVREVLDEE